MNVLIISSANDNIDDYYKNIATKISNFLSTRNCDLIFGGCSLSMMGACYQEFIKNGRKVYAYSNDEFAKNLESLKDSISTVVATTFDLKKVMFEQCDVIVCLPGGIGTASELLSYIEEKKTYDNEKPIIIYDENNFYDYLMLQLKKMEEENFLKKKLVDTFEIARNMEEFEKIFNRIKEIE
ncbi:MAG: LOG family protein [Bacilli bacterium]|nr:LOG family protein [Bacilli bacterium]MDD4548057.1 LOG family protein [Bacilli bacterium]